MAPYKASKRGFIRKRQKIVFSQGQKRYPKELLRQRFRRTSGELSDTICLKTLVLLGSALELFRKFFGAVLVIFWLWGSFLAPDSRFSSFLEQSII